MNFSISFGRSPKTIERREQTKSGLLMAESVLREARNKYGKPNSASYIEMKTLQHKNDPKYTDILNKLNDNAEEYSESLKYKPYLNINFTIHSGKKDGMKYVGDCGECAQVIQNEFVIKHGKPTVNVVLNANKENGEFCNHAFNLSNMQEGAKIDDPKTWGEQAIITDLWSGIAKKAQDAITYFNQIFMINPKTDEITYEAMPDSENSLQEYCLKHFNMKA